MSVRHVRVSAGSIDLLKERALILEIKKSKTMPSGIFKKSANYNRDEFHYGGRFNQKHRQAMLTMENL